LRAHLPLAAKPGLPFAKLFHLRAQVIRWLLHTAFFKRSLESIR